MDKIGIVAGSGNLPYIAASSAKKEGFSVYVAAVAGAADRKIEDIADKVVWVKLGEIKKLARFFSENGVGNVCFEGKIQKVSIFSGNVKPDLDMLFLFSKLKDRKDDTILGAICGYFADKGITVIDSTRFLKDIMPEDGVYSKKKPSGKDWEDIKFGWDIAKAIGGLDIGQSVVVKGKAVLAVEAIEGTDEAIKRGGKLGRGDVVVVKVAKPNQDMRFDVPAIGCGTVNTLAEAGGKLIAFEAGKTLFIDMDETLEFANKYGIVVVGVKK